VEKGKTFDDSKIVDAQSAVYFEYLLKNLPDTTYNLTSTELGTNAKTSEYYRNNEYDYVITSSFVSWRAYSRQWAEKHPVAAEFYRSVDKTFPIVKRFEPTATRSGPIITIYRVR
jgi:hypothetical protein